MGRDREYAISDESSRLFRRGYDHQVVYRHGIEVNLAEIALSTTSLSQRFNMVVSRGRDWAVIGFRNDQDEQRIRSQVRSFKQALGIAGGVV